LGNAKEEAGEGDSERGGAGEKPEEDSEVWIRGTKAEEKISADGGVVIYRRSIGPVTGFKRTGKAAFEISRVLGFLLADSFCLYVEKKGPRLS
jgi:hypothetical protein